MKEFLRKPYRFALLYGTILVLFSGFVLLDTFVIPKGYGTAEERDDRPGQTEARTDVAGTSTIRTEEPSDLPSGDSSQDLEAPEDSGSGSEDFPSQPEIGENYYRDENISVTLVETRHLNTDVYVAEVKIRSAEYLQTAFAEDTYGRNIKEKTSDIAERVGAILAVNGDFYGFRNEGYVIRNGKLYREKKLSSSREDLVIDENGLMYWIREGKVSAEDLWNGGAEQVLSFGPVLLDDSRVQVTSADEIGKWDSNPRTAIGMIEPLHYLFVVSDGRTDRSAGLSLVQLAEFMESWGCTFAYNLDGGGSATMVFQGRLINKPTTDGKSFGERKVSDVVYIGY